MSEWVGNHGTVGCEKVCMLGRVGVGGRMSFGECEDPVFGKTIAVRWGEKDRRIRNACKMKK